MNDLALKARSLAGDKFKSGYNCAESILHAFNEILNNPLNQECVKNGFRLRRRIRACRLHVRNIDRISHGPGPSKRSHRQQASQRTHI